MAPQPVTLATLQAVQPQPAIVPQPDVTWKHARKIFTPPQNQNNIRLDQTVWEDEFEATGEWNTKPSRVEAFLARYDKNQTLTTLAFVALLLLWIY